MNSTKSLQEEFQTVISTYPAADTYWIAYSGGVDSAVLLHLMYEFRDQYEASLEAVHIHHGLIKESDSWIKHTESVCKSYGISYRCLKADFKNVKVSNMEELARNERYRLFSETMMPGDVLFTAHHQDDQTETFLLQLFRGAGPDGLSSMPGLKKFENKWIARPMLKFSRNSIVTYANEKSLSWIEDKSNLDENIDRNYLRHQILPQLKERWPSLNKTISRSSLHQAECASLLKKFAQYDLEYLLDENQNILKIEKLKDLNHERIKNIIRHWIRINKLPVQKSVITEKIITELIYAKEDALPCIDIGTSQLRRFKNNLYLLKKIEENDYEVNTSWDITKKMKLKNGILYAVPSISTGIRKNLIKKNIVSVKFRRGGETINLPGKRHSQKLKKLFQEAEIPPWHREIVPLIFIDDSLAAVAGLWTDSMFMANDDEAGFDVHFEPNIYLIEK